MNLLQLVQAASGEMGLAVPTYAAGNATRDIVQMVALLNALGAELQQEFNWQGLQKEYRFTTQYLSTTGALSAGSAIVTGIPSTAGLDATYMVAGTGINQDTYVQSVDSDTQVTLSQTATTAGTGVALTFGKTKYALPSDFSRITNRTEYDKSKRWEMAGPSTAQEWQFLKSSYISTGPRLRFRIMGGYLQIWPLIASSEYLGFEYQSNGWVNPATSPAQTFGSDNDVCVYPDRLMVLGLKLKYFEIKGFDTSALFRDYSRQLDLAKAADHGAPTLSMGARTGAVLIGAENIPDTGYGV